MTLPTGCLSIDPRLPLSCKCASLLSAAQFSRLSDGSKADPLLPHQVQAASTQRLAPLLRIHTSSFVFELTEATVHQLYISELEGYIPIDKSYKRKGCRG